MRERPQGKRDQVSFLRRDPTSFPPAAPVSAPELDTINGYWTSSLFAQREFCKRRSSSCVWFVAQGIVKPTWTTLAFGKVWGASWPILGGLVIVAWLRSHHSLRSQLEKVRIPAGDLTIPVDLAIWWFRRIWQAVVIRGIHKLRARASRLRVQAIRPALGAVTNGLEDDLTAGVLIGLLGLVMLLLIM